MSDTVWASRPVVSTILVIIGIFGLSLLLGVQNGTIPITKASRIKYERNQQTENVSELQKRMQAAEDLAKRIEFFQEPDTGICYSHIRVYTGSTSLSEVQGPFDCKNPGIAKKLKNGITTEP